MIQRRIRPGKECKDIIPFVRILFSGFGRLTLSAACRDDAEHFRMEEEMGRLLAEKDAAENRSDMLERRLAVLQSDFVCFLTNLFSTVVLTFHRKTQVTS